MRSTDSDDRRSHLRFLTSLRPLRFRRWGVCGRNGEQDLIAGLLKLDPRLDSRHADRWFASFLQWVGLANVINATSAEWLFQPPLAVRLTELSQAEVNQPPHKPYYCLNNISSKERPDV
jgi:hypothetical protein